MIVHYDRKTFIVQATQKLGFFNSHCCGNGCRQIVVAARCRTGKIKIRRPVLVVRRLLRQRIQRGLRGRREGLRRRTETVLAGERRRTEVVGLDSGKGVPRHAEKEMVKITFQ
jgi:hypothetical protein